MACRSHFTGRRSCLYAASSLSLMWSSTNKLTSVCSHYRLGYYNCFWTGFYFAWDSRHKHERPCISHRHLDLKAPWAVKTRYSNRSQCSGSPLYPSICVQFCLTALSSEGETVLFSLNSSHCFCYLAFYLGKLSGKSRSPKQAQIRYSRAYSYR
jgi:hypothetical protein